jgi:predicted Zn-dependent protease
MAIQIEFPEGWKHANQRAAVVAVSAEEDGAVQLTVAGEETAAAALASFFRKEGVTKKGEPMASIHGLRTAGDGFTAPLGGGNVEGRVGFVEHGGLVFQLLGYATDAAWPQRERTIRRCLASFDRLTDRRYLDVEPKRLKIVQVARPESLAAFARRNGSTVPLETLELINRLDPGETLEPGRAYKVITGGELP